MKNLHIEDTIRYQYLFDRLSYNDKLILCYSVLVYLKECESYETYDPMVTRFKDSIRTTCDKHNIYL